MKLSAVWMSEFELDLERSLYSEGRVNKYAKVQFT